MDLSWHGMMKIALAQFNPIVGDIAGNVAKSAAMISQAKQAGASLVVFPELSVIGYPPRDLLGKERFVEDNIAAVEHLAAECDGISALVGFVRRAPDTTGRPLQNAAALLGDGQIQAIHVKTLLPTYDVFDETRYFEPGDDVMCFDIGGLRVGVSICEDLWDAESLGRELYDRDPIGRLVDAGAQLVVNMAASPFEMTKADTRESLFARQAKRHNVTIAYVNQVGGNDDLVFDGHSAVFDASGKILARGRSFAEDILVTDLSSPESCPDSPLDHYGQLYEALKLGLRDYVLKCGFSKVVFGLSGGIDSALVAVLAADALGPEAVTGLAMPSRYSSNHSLADAEQLASNLGIHYAVVPIGSMHDAFEVGLANLLADAGGGAEVAHENVQARIRGVIVMAHSNAHGALALATGNKSELSVGYCTLYGDMCGGLAPIGDVLKTEVYALSEWINAQAGYDRIPRNIITKAPSAELKPGQIDQDKLPPYDVLDAILRRYIEADESAATIIQSGLDSDTVRQIVRMVDVTEYKRRQAAPTLKVTSRAFGTGRRMPIAQRYE
jgi:NAD+ synthase (glutamine-hydrolysing)